MAGFPHVIKNTTRKNRLVWARSLQKEALSFSSSCLYGSMCIMVYYGYVYTIFCEFSFSKTHSQTHSQRHENQNADRPSFNRVILLPAPCMPRTGSGSSKKLAKGCIMELPGYERLACHVFPKSFCTSGVVEFKFFLAETWPSQEKEPSVCTVKIK